MESRIENGDGGGVRKRGFESVETDKVSGGMKRA